MCKTDLEKHHAYPCHVRHVWREFFLKVEDRAADLTTSIEQIVCKH